jgi:hypothetical protein
LQLQRLSEGAPRLVGEKRQSDLAGSATARGGRNDRPLSHRYGQFTSNRRDEYPLLSWFNGKLANAMKREKVKRTLDGGESIVEHLLYEMNSSIKKYSGYEPLDLTPQDGMTIARYAWRQTSISVAISGLERRNNQGEAKMIDLWKAKVTQSEQTLRDQYSRDFFGNNADGKSVDGLGVIVSNSATCGGLAPATYPWWVATVTASGSFATQGLKDMRTLYNTLSYGNNKPDGLFTTQSVFESYESALQPLERYVNDTIANSGFDNLRFKATPLFFDRDCPAGTLFMLNSRNIKWNVHKDADFTTTDVITPNDQDASSCLILVQGNLTTNERRKLGKLTGITA